MERTNLRTFRGKVNFINHVWDCIIRKIKETILSEEWESADWDQAGRETPILCAWGFSGPSGTETGRMKQQRIPRSPDKWLPPPEGLPKLDFDKAFKGHLGLIGYGFII